jgi:DNA repair exonuclease SbcCD nuclease subunit
MEIRIVTSSDEHIADLSPGFRKDDYRNAILKKLEWQRDFANKFNAHAFIRGGDLFHVKAANKTTMATLASVADIHRGFKCPVFAISGNHDISHNNIETVLRQPIGVLFNSGALQRLRKICLETETSKTYITGVDYDPDLDHEGLHDLVRKDEDSTYTIAVVHGLAAFAPEQRIQSFFNERIFDYRDLVFEGCPDIYVFGHYHKDQGVQEHLGVYFINLGAISRGSLTFEDLNRKPKISTIIINSQGVSIEEHEVPCIDASEVFDLEKKEQIDKEKKSLNDFINHLKSNAALVGDEGIKGRLRIFQQSNYPDDLKRVVLDTIEAAESGVLDE